MKKVFQSLITILAVTGVFGQSIFDAEKKLYPWRQRQLFAHSDSCHAIFENSAWCQGGAMGEAGIVADPSAASMHYNASNLAFAEDKNAISLNFTPC